MRNLWIVLLLVGCQRVEKTQQPEAEPTSQPTTPRDKAAVGSAGVAPKPDLPKVEQIQPAIDITTPPLDAMKTSSGLIYKKLAENPSGASPKRNDTVLINYTGWRHSTGETFFSNTNQGQPMPLNLSSTAPGFSEAMQLLKQGERIMLWLPPEIGYKGPPQGSPEMLVYEIELVEIVTAPPVPADFKAPPAHAKTLKSGAKYIVVKPGGKQRARSFDSVTFDYSAWDGEGRMFDSTEMRKRPATVPPFRQSAVMEDVLTTIGKGERVRFWVDSEKMAVGGKASGLPQGQLCYELEVQDIQKATANPPPVPPDVKAPPAAAKTTELGVAYKVLRGGKAGPKPAPDDTVKVHYTGWTTDGRMFDSSVIKGQPAEFALTAVIKGWTEGIPVMSVGDRMRFWIPEELAYKGSPGRPQGMLVFDVDLLEIKPKAPQDDGHGHGAPPPPQQPAPPDVAKPPGDAKKTPKGVFYKVLDAKKGAARAKPGDDVRVSYTGWTTDGRQFDTNVGTWFSLARVIEGWQDAIPLVGVGEKARLWIPEELAYKGGEPKGMLVFDVEVVEVKSKP